MQQLVETEFIDLGLAEYVEVWRRQEEVFQRNIEAKGHEPPLPTHPVLFFCEHPPVYTLGKSGDAGNLLASEAFLARIGATCHRSDRGGDITFHGPGQLVGYPIFDLDALGMGTRAYVSGLEEAIIRALATWGLRGERLEGAAGVWLDPQGSRPRKVCAIGVRASRGVTMHGFALNVNTDLGFFAHINPCGFTDKGVSSLAQELGHAVPMEQAKRRVLEALAEVFPISTNG